MQKTLTNFSTWLYCLILSFICTQVSAASIDDVKIPDTIIQAESGHKLLLNGAGIRSKFFFSIYIGALYLPDKTHSASAILKQETPNRVMMYCLYHEIDKQKLVDAWNEGFSSNLDQQHLTDLKQRIDQFNKIFPPLKKGDVVLIDYTPGKGTRLHYNGKLLGSISGKDFNQALLSIWLGKQPADDDLKKAMLGEE